jgi:hypothetical protein
MGLKHLQGTSESVDEQQVPDICRAVGLAVTGQWQGSCGAVVGSSVAVAGSSVAVVGRFQDYEGVVLKRFWGC